MYSIVTTAIVYGLEGRCIRVEADVSNGLPVFEMVGFLSSEVKEPKERCAQLCITARIYTSRPKRITINLFPANVKKSGTGFDLPIAVAILAALGEIEKNALENTLIAGEISLSGQVQPVQGVLPIVANGKRAGDQAVYPAICEHDRSQADRRRYNLGREGSFGTDSIFKGKNICRKRAYLYRRNRTE